MLPKMDDLAERAKKIAADAGASMKEKLSEFKSKEDWDELRKVAAGLGEDAAGFVRKYPLQSVLGAAVLGFLLGTQLGRKR